MEEWQMKRALLGAAIVLMCTCLTGCTLYFGGWATASGRVVECAEGSEGQVIQIPVCGAIVTLTSASNPDYSLNCDTDEKGYWFTPVKVKCDMYKVTAKMDGYADAGPIDFPIAKRGAHCIMERPIVMQKHK